MSAPHRLVRANIALAIASGVLVTDTLVIGWLWAEGVNFAILDRVEPGGSGFRIEPLLGTYRWLLDAVVVANVLLLAYLLVKKPLRYAVSFVVGATVPMLYLINMLL